MARKHKVLNIKNASNMDEWMEKTSRNPKKQIRDNMIRGYQEMAEINLKLSEFCFEAEREVEQFFEKIAECE
ncbi:MAG: hypothetical protein PWP07_1124 [Epulopiscium sp.]|jgi:hypothetical protein|uniref:CopG family transcriptional regulator n=1 Tax=Defluviitalea raffinosedens TaxID=1450156 RepID=A0A7C8HG62_9FIRM|nr:hypothetical protein [Defluviitalea raffinosedens]MBZ4668793.1 hypothetical protein [Defluviitaleaceae bacterium]MDK2787899.1 hypothetical protein [Candidatus Epulonipiscium sp.]KAE9635397.1 hypothetical protein GND95_04420 [Defluviitalea raffinosedens]MBM7684300.1 hypothetical protein [Defluviitalea raffinosedens]HHW67576.1 hypothetical protein [Candidatus Epulonipiscium sp.]